MKPIQPVAACLITLIACAPAGGAGSTGTSQQPLGGGEANGHAVRLLKSIPLPVSALNTVGKVLAFDISWVDELTNNYYLADRSNRAVDNLDATESTVTPIFPNNGHAPFAGSAKCPFPAGPFDCNGPNGVVAAFPFLFVSDGQSRLLSFDLRTSPPTTVSEVQTLAGEPTRADEMGYDPEDGLILVTDNAASPPFATLVSVDGSGNLAVVKNIIYDAAHGVDATNGAEQAVFDPLTRKFFQSIPEIGEHVNPGTNLHGAVLRISTTGTVEAVYPVDQCGPQGLVLGPGTDLFINCSTVFDTAGEKWTGNADIEQNSAAPQIVILDRITGNVAANVQGAGVGDEAWFNPGDGRYYAAWSGSPFAPSAISPARPPVGTATAPPPVTSQGAAVLGVIDAFSRKVDQQVPTFNLPPLFPAHSVAASLWTNHVFVPVAANNAFPNCLKGCIGVYGRDD